MESAHVSVNLSLFVTLFVLRAASQTQHIIDSYRASDSERCVCPQPHVTINPPVCGRSVPVSPDTCCNCTTLKETLSSELNDTLRREVDEIQVAVSGIQENVSSELQDIRRQLEMQQSSVTSIVELLNENAPPTVDATACSCTGSPSCQELNDVIASLRESVELLTERLDRPQVVTVKTAIEDFDYPVIELDGARWRQFWWFTANSSWPSSATDVLQDAYGDCDANSSYCFSRLPSILGENSAEMLGRDSAGNEYRWSFDPDNSVAHAVWQAFHSHEEVKITGGNPWSPKVISGTAPGQTQDSFHYREEHGVKSLQIDDDNCDCYTSLSLGHGMCGEAFSTSYGPENVFGVDLLYDAYCQTPSPVNGLTLYFKDDDDCAQEACPDGFRCSDGIYAYNCISA